MPDLNGAATEAMLAEVVAFRNLAASLNETWHGRRLDEHQEMMMALLVWFQDLMRGEPAAFWQRCFRHLGQVTMEETLRLWMDYPEHWEIPGALRNAGVDPTTVVFADGWGMVPVRKPRGRHQVDCDLEGSRVHVSEAFVGSAGTFVRGTVSRSEGDGPPQAVAQLADWHRVFRRPTPGKAAVERAIRMCVLSRLCGRRLGSSKEMLIAEGQAWLRWALAAGPDSRLTDTARGVMRALLLDDEFVLLVHQLPARSRS